MRHLVTVVSLGVLACSSGEGLSRRTGAVAPDASGAGGDVSALVTPDTGPPSDTRKVTEASPVDALIADAAREAAPDTTPADATAAAQRLDSGVTADAGLLPDTAAPLPPDARPLSPDTLPPDSRAKTDAYRAPDALAPDTAPLRFPSCKYLSFLVNRLEAGSYCGRYPQDGPNGAIYCYLDCTVVSIFDVPTVPVGVEPDGTNEGYCGGTIDTTKATPGGSKSQTGLCVGTADTCARVCPR